MKHIGSKLIKTHSPDSSDFLMRMVKHDKYIIEGNINKRNMYLHRLTCGEFRFVPDRRYATEYSLRTAEKHLRYLRTGMENVVILANIRPDESIIRLVESPQ